MRGSEPAPLQLRLRARLEDISLLRERVRPWLETAGADPREVFEVLLATTEAFTNAIEHPREPSSHAVDVEVSINDDAVIVSIRDFGAWERENTRKEDGGLGLVIIEALTEAFQVESLGDGTRVTMRRQLAKR
jgi:anti-sigma regulatory factor (Ser/Thr protein kinase)